MAKSPKKKARSVWSAEGKSVEDLIKMGSDYNRYKRLTESTLRKVVNRLASAGNKRLRRMEAAGESSPAYREVQQSGGKFTTKGKTLEGLQREFLRAKQFFEDKTSSLQFWKKTKTDASNRAERDKVVTPTAPQRPVTPPVPIQPVQEEPPEILPPQMKYKEVREDGSILLEDGTVYYMDQDQIVNPETGEILGSFHGAQNRDKYAVDSPGYAKVVGDIWGAVDDLISEDPIYRDRAFRYAVFDAIENEFLSDHEGGRTIEEIRDMVGSRLGELHHTQMRRIGEAGRHGVSTFFEE